MDKNNGVEESYAKPDMLSGKMWEPRNPVSVDVDENLENKLKNSESKPENWESKYESPGSHVYPSASFGIQFLDGTVFLKSLLTLPQVLPGPKRADSPVGLFLS